MSKKKEITILLIGNLVLLVILSLVFAALLPTLTNREMVKETIKNKVVQGVGGEIKYLRLELFYLPRPHLEIHGAELQIPDSFTIKIQRMKVYPKIMPLLIGRLQVGLVALENADYFMDIPHFSGETLAAENVSSVDKALKEISSAVGRLPAFKLPDLNLRLKSGSVNLTDPIGRRFNLSNVQGNYQRRPDKLDFSINGKSSLWARIDIKGSLNPSNFKGRTRIQISRLRLQAISDYILSDFLLQDSDTGTNLDLDLVFDGTGNLTARFNGAIRRLAMGHEEGGMIVQGGRIEGAIRIGANVAKITLKKLELDHPKLNASGVFSYDQTQQDFQLGIDGSQIDAASLRQVAMTVAGESKTVRNIFNIIRGGQVSWLTLQVQGKSIAELGMLDNVAIQGRITQGKIFIPKIAQDLEDVVADAVISKGILIGENLQARLGNTYGQDGKLTLGLNKKLAPFQLRIGLTVDLSQLPSILARIIDNKATLHELAQVRAASGSATGTLTLGGDPADLKVEVALSKVQFNAHYRALPEPIEIDSQRVVVSAFGMLFDNLNAKTGNSFLSQVSGDINWAGTANLNVKSKLAKLDVAELQVLVRTFDRLQPALRDLAATSGTVELRDLDLKGPLKQPGRWHCNLKGIIQNVVLSSETFRDSVIVNKGSVDVVSEISSGRSRTRIDVVKANLTWSGHHLNLLGGLKFAKDGSLLDLTVTADSIDWEQLERILSYFKKRKTGKGQVLGTLKVQADNFNYQSFSVRPLHAKILFKPNKVIIEIKQAVVCGIPFHGLLMVSNQIVEIYLIPAAENQNLAAAVSCLTDQKDEVTGTFNLNGQISAKSKPDAFRRSLTGDIDFSANKGRIQRFGLLAKMLAVLNITEIYRGEVPELTGEGFAYHGMTVRALVKGGELIMQECVVDGASMGISCEGSVDFIDNELDLTVLLAPFKTADRIVKFLPLVGHVLGGKLISIPFRIQGDLKDPDVTPLHPAAVGSGVLGVLERTLKLPITIIQPVFSGTNK